MIMGMMEEYRGRGADAVFYLETAEEALKRGYKRLEGSWILETNTMMNQIIERLGRHTIQDLPDLREALCEEFSSPARPVSSAASWPHALVRRGDQSACCAGPTPSTLMLDGLDVEHVFGDILERGGR